MRRPTKRQQALAFGDPGANPAASSLAHGHSAWGDSIAIPDVVEKCVHFVAMHEQRNSFPCDLVRVDDVYPANCEEYVYHGVHSDVGGGYEAGEQGRSADDAQKLSQLPLLHMHAVAIEHGVPLQGVHYVGANDIVRYAGSDMPDAPPNAETAQAGRPSAETA